MSLSNADTVQLLLALTLLLLCAHVCGELAIVLRQPRVAGEILGGLLLSPTVFGLVLPGLQRAVFQQGAPAAALGAVYQLGLFLLMFCSGAAVRSAASSRDERKVTALIALVGNVVPFAGGLLFVSVFNVSWLMGGAHSRLAFTLVFACALAVTSIPVISKIMADLGILSTPFARIVLAVAIVEDVVLYIVLSVALGLVQPPQASTLSLPALLSIKGNTVAGDAYYVIASVAFFTLPLVLGRMLQARPGSSRPKVLDRMDSVTMQLLLLFVLTALALFLGVAAYFGAFVAGVLAGRIFGPSTAARESIQRFSFAFFIPVYFAIVGLRLDLLRQFNLDFFLVLLVYACVLKAASVFGAARLAGMTATTARNLAMALNARGGPAIVLASVAFDARIINERFYVQLILLALVTSAVAGAWLDRELRRAGTGDGLLTAPAGPRPSVVATE